MIFFLIFYRSCYYFPSLLFSLLFSSHCFFFSSHRSSLIFLSTQVIPSLVDNAPYTVYECLYSGIPFLASSTPSITPLLSKFEHHLFSPQPHHLASRIVHAMKNGLSSAKKVFSIEKAEDVWTSFLSTLKEQKALGMFLFY